MDTLTKIAGPVIMGLVLVAFCWWLAGCAHQDDAAMWKDISKCVGTRGCGY
jgi:hypothetical protein